MNPKGVADSGPWDERADGTIVWGANQSGFNHEQLWAVDPAGNYRMIWNSDTWDAITACVVGPENGGSPASMV